MKLSINGELISIKGGKGLTNLAMVIEELGYQPQTVVVEFNEVIINQDNWTKQRVKEGDQLEIVTIVGGGDPVK